MALGFIRKKNGKNQFIPTDSPAPLRFKASQTTPEIKPKGRIGRFKKIIKKPDEIARQKVDEENRVNLLKAETARKDLEAKNFEAKQKKLEQDIINSTKALNLIRLRSGTPQVENIKTKEQLDREKKIVPTPEPAKASQTTSINPKSTASPITGTMPTSNVPQGKGGAVPIQSGTETQSPTSNISPAEPKVETGNRTAFGGIKVSDIEKERVDATLAKSKVTTLKQVFGKIATLTKEPQLGKIAKKSQEEKNLDEQKKILDQQLKDAIGDKEKIAKELEKKLQQGKSQDSNGSISAQLTVLTNEINGVRTTFKPAFDSYVQEKIRIRKEQSDSKTLKDIEDQIAKEEKASAKEDERIQKKLDDQQKKDDAEQERADKKQAEKEAKELREEQRQAEGNKLTPKQQRLKRQGILDTGNVSATAVGSTFFS
jgi:hypothetical protein